MQGMKRYKIGHAPLRQNNDNLFAAFKHAAQCLLKSCLIITIYSFIIWLLSAKVHGQEDASIMSSSKTLLHYTSAYTLKDKRLSLSRFSAQWSSRLHFNPQWSGQIELGAEFADDDVGLGGVNNFAPYSQDWIHEDHVRLGLNQFLLSWRSGTNTVDLGKQVIPWGLLDGVQVSDRFDPVRRRDYVFAQIKPERLARWGLRWRTELNNWQFDSALVFDGTVSQQANVADEFQLRAPRFVAGLELSKLANGRHFQLTSEQRSHGLHQSTLGLRVSHHVGAGELSILGFRGPDTEPVLLLATTSSQLIDIRLHYPRRSVMAINYDVSQGAVVWRVEAAYILDQTVNMPSSQPMQLTQGARSLVGLGLDWQGSNEIFINAQLMLDYIDLPAQQRFRPKTDSIMTLRIQRPFFNQRLLLKTEVITSLNQHDGIFRPGFIYELNDNTTLNGGLDWAFGQRQGQFGQFKDASRLWVGVSFGF